MPPEEEKDLPALREIPLRPDSPAAMLTAAIKKGIGVEGIRALAEIYERMEAKRAEREFTAALLAFRAECPPIAKTDEGVHHSKFAPIHKIAAIIDPVLARHGFTYTFNTDLQAKQISCTCTLRHIGGHSSDTLFSAPVEAKQGMSDMHATASTVSFAKRYALQLALGIVTGLVDDDGKAGTGGGPISQEQRHTLEVLLEETKLDTEAFWKYANVERGRLAELAAKDYARVQQALLQRKAKMQEARHASH